MSPTKVLASLSPATAAKALAAYLKKLDPGAEVLVWSPKEATEHGWGSGWAVCWEGGPFDWALALSGGSSIYAGESGCYSTPGAFPEGLSAHGWYAEAYNGFILSFHKV